MSMVLFFVQGAPYLWMAMTCISLLLTVLQSILKRDVQYATVPTVALPLLFLGLVIVLTAQLTGGIGLAAFGGGESGGMIGGKRYIQLFCAIAGYFAISSHRIDPAQSNKYVAVYFLGFLTMILGSIAPWMPRGAYWLYALFPVENMAFASGPDASLGEVRVAGVSLAATGVLYFILAKYGLTGLLRLGEQWRFLPLHFRGSFGINQPWRILAVAGILFVSLLGGFRSAPLTLALLCGFLFFQERLHRTPWAITLALVTILGMVLIVPFANRMPLTVQRSLSFLPIEIDPEIKANADDSTEWRVRMWEQVIPMIPQYLLIGKGYGIDAREQAMAETIEGGLAVGLDKFDGSMRAGDYHSGPLSLIIPLGLFGLIGFLWFVVVAFRVLFDNRRYGDPAHLQVNTFLLALFAMKTIWFFVAYGSFQNDLAIFTGILGLSCALNGGMRRPVTAPAKPNPAYLPFRLPKPLRANA
jgi:hypothetical protein